MRIIMLILTLFLLNVASANVHKIDTLVITDSSIIINKNIVLSFPLTIETLESILGDARISKTKSETEQNDIYFWDKLGVMVFCPKHERNVSSFDICFRKSFWEETRKMFKGVVIVGNAEIHKNMSRADLESLGFGGKASATATFDEFRSLELLDLSIIAEFKENQGRFIGFGIFPGYSMSPGF